MNLLKQLFLGLLMVWIAYVVCAYASEMKILRKPLQYLIDVGLYAYIMVCIPGIISGFLTALFAKEKEWFNNTIVGLIIALGGVVCLLLITKESYDEWYILTLMSYGAVHILCFSFAGFILQKRRLDKLKNYHVTDKRIDSFGEKFKERK